MLEISKDQMATLDAHYEAMFLGRCEVHLRACFPEACTQLDEIGPHSLPELIRYGVEKARSYDLVDGRAISKFLNIMIIFGRDFDRDPSCAWARPILARSVIDLDRSMVDELYRAAVDHESEATGLPALVAEKER